MAVSSGIWLLFTTKEGISGQFGYKRLGLVGGSRIARARLVPQTLGCKKSPFCPIQRFAKYKGYDWSLKRLVPTIQVGVQDGSNQVALVLASIGSEDAPEDNPPAVA